MTLEVHRKSQSWASGTGCIRGKTVFLFPSYFGINRRGVHKLPGPPETSTTWFLLLPVLTWWSKLTIAKIPGADGWPQGTGSQPSSLGGEQHRGGSSLALDNTKVWGRTCGPEILPCEHLYSHVPPRRSSITDMGPRIPFLSCCPSPFPVPWNHTPGALKLIVPGTGRWGCIKIIY